MIAFGAVEHAGQAERKRRSGIAAVFAQMAGLIELSGRLPLVFALFMGVGAALYFSLPFEPGTGLALLVFLAGLAAFRGGMRTARLVVLAIAIFGTACGFVAGKAATLRVSHPVIAAPLGPVMVEGWIEEVEAGGKGPRLRLLVHAIDGLGPTKTPRHIRLTHTSRLAVDTGRFVRCWAVLRPPPAPVMQGDYAFDREAWYQGLGAVGYVQGRCRGGTLGAPQNWTDRLSLEVAQARRALARYVNEAAGARAGGFAAAVASGDRSFMSEADKEHLRGSGLAHLLAISGLHMGIVGGLVYLLVWRALALIEPLALRISVRKPAAVAALLISFVYLILSGGSVSTQRAFIMALVFFGAIIFDRSALSLRSLAIAMILVLALSPSSVLSPGFQMSFAATGVLITTYEIWQQRRRSEGLALQGGVWFWVKSVVVTSLVTSLATVPFALYHFDRMAPMGLIANVFAMPVVSLISAPLAAASLVAAPFGLSEWPLRGFGLSLEVILWIADVFSSEDSGEVGKRMPDSALALFSVAMILALVGKGWRARVILMGGLSAIGLLVWQMTSEPVVHFAPSGEVVLMGGAGTQKLGFAKGPGLSPLRYSDLQADPACAGRSCILSHRGYRIVLMAADETGGMAIGCEVMAEADLILFAGDLAADRAAKTCGADTPDLIALNEAVRQNGITFRATGRGPGHAAGGRLQIIRKPDCTARPWRTCAA